MTARLLVEYRQHGDGKETLARLRMTFKNILLAAVTLLVIFNGCNPSTNGSDDETSDSIVQGKAIYQTRCASCHGADGQGQPNPSLQNADKTYPAPPHDKSGHTWHHGDGTLFRIVQEGGKIFEQPGFVSAMPSFGGDLSPEEIRAVLSYIKTFWGPRERQVQAEQSIRDPLP